MLLGEFAARAERAGWLTLQRELGDRHRDDVRLAEAIAEDCDALIGRADALAAVGQAVERGARWLRPRRITVGEVGNEPAYDRRRARSGRRDAATPSVSSTRCSADTERPGAILLYDEAHLLADDRGRERFPLSTLLAALGAVQREHQRVRIILCGLPTLSLNLKRARTYAERMFRHVSSATSSWMTAEEALGHPAGRQRTQLRPVTDRRDRASRPPAIPISCSSSVRSLCSRIGLEHIELADFQRVEPALLYELDLAFFEDRFEGAPQTEQLVLEAMARDAGPVTLRRLRPQLSDVASVDLLVRRLIERGLLYRTGRATYNFALPLFRSFIRRRRQLTRLTRTVRNSVRTPRDNDDA